MFVPFARSDYIAFRLYRGAIRLYCAYKFFERNLTPDYTHQVYVFDNQQKTIGKFLTKIAQHLKLLSISISRYFTYYYT